MDSQSKLTTDQYTEVLTTKERALEARKRISFEKSNFTLVPQAVVAELRLDLDSTHRLQGASVCCDELYLGFDLSDDELIPEKDVSTCGILPYRWYSIFGSSVSLTITTECPRSKKIRLLGYIQIPCSSDTFKKLEEKKLKLVFFLKKKIHRVFDVDLNADVFVSEWFTSELVRENLDSTKVVHSDFQALYWEISSQIGFISKRFSKSEQVSSSWVKTYGRVLEEASQILELLEFHQVDVRKFRANCEAEPFKNILDAFLNSGFTWEAYWNELSLHLGDRNWWSQFFYSLQDLAATANQKQSDHFFSYLHEGMTCAILLYPLSSRISDNGRRLCWVSGFPPHTISSLIIQSADFSDKEIEDYWTVMPSMKPWGDLLLKPDDVPANFQDHVADWKQVEVQSDVNSTNELADFLIDEGLAGKEYVAPPGALVELTFGPLRYCRIFETTNHVFFKVLDKENRFLVVELSLATKSWTMGVVFWEEDPSLAAGLKLILSALLRDFWVVENRDAVFGSKVLEEKSSRKMGSSSQVVYLPRVKYSNKVSIERCVAELNVEIRAPHRVSGHLRKVDNPSEHQMVLASKYGISLQEGYTFVRPHFRGVVDDEKVFRSKSATGLLYEEIRSVSSDNVKLNWFQFEKDVERVVRDLGFITEHKAASRNGDQGIDVLASKKGSKGDHWVVQCKCYSPHRKVDVAVVRELLGTLKVYKQEAKGVIVTTSSFTSDAIKLAKEFGIRLIDGKEFLVLSQRN